MDADAQVANAATVQSMKGYGELQGQTSGVRARCQLFHNNGDLRFEEVGERFGFHAERTARGGGMVVCDLDNDGDLDVSSQPDGQPEIYRNDCAAARIAVRLQAGALILQALVRR